MSRPIFSARAVAALFLERQHLDRPRTRRLTAASLARFAEDTGGIQLDSINVVDRAHLLTLWSRFGPYRRSALERLIYDRRVLFEYWAHVGVREVAARLGVNPPLPDLDMLTRDEAEEVRVLCDAIAHGSARRPAQGHTISAKVVIDPDSPALGLLRSADLSHVFFAVRRQEPAVLFGVVSARWTLLHDISNLRVARESLNDLRAAVNGGVPGRIMLIPADHSAAIVTRLLAAGDPIDSLTFTK